MATEIKDIVANIMDVDEYVCFGKVGYLEEADGELE